MRESLSTVWSQDTIAGAGSALWAAVKYTGASPAAGHDRWQSFLCEPKRLVQFVEEVAQPANEGALNGVQGTPPRSTFLLDNE